MHKRFNTTFCTTPKKSTLKPILPPCPILTKKEDIEFKSDRNFFKQYMEEQVQSLNKDILFTNYKHVYFSPEKIPSSPLGNVT